MLTVDDRAACLKRRGAAVFAGLHAAPALLRGFLSRTSLMSRAHRRPGPLAEIFSVLSQAASSRSC